MVAAVAMIFAACAGPQAQGPAGAPTDDAVGSSNTALAPTTGIPAATGPPRSTPHPALTWNISGVEGQGHPQDGGFTLALSLDPQDRGVSGAQFTLRFPPGSVQVLRVVPGGLLGLGHLLVEKAGPEPGGHIIALARRGETSAPTSAGTLAEIYLKANPIPIGTDGDTGGGQDVIIWLDRVKVVDGSFQVISGPALTGTISSSN